MKKLLTITAILISLNCFGQYSYEPLRVGVTKYNNTNSLVHPLDCGISQDTTKPTFIGFEEGRTGTNVVLGYPAPAYPSQPISLGYNAGSHATCAIMIDSTIIGWIDNMGNFHFKEGIEKKKFTINELEKLYNIYHREVYKPTFEGFMDWLKEKK